MFHIFLREAVSIFIIKISIIWMTSINMQQNNYVKQTKLQLFPRERPLQKSMLSAQIQNHHNTPTPRNNPIEFSSFTPLKKSLYTPTESTSSPNTINYNLGSIPPPTFESRISTLSEPIHQSYTLKSLLSPFKSDPKSEQSPEDNPRLISKYQKRFSQVSDNRIQSSQIDNLCYEVITQIKEKHLPELLGQLKKQVFENINTLKQQFQSLRDEMRSNFRKQDSVPAVNPSQILNSFGKLKIEQELSELQTQCFLMQGRINQFEGKLSQTSKVIVNELERFNNRFELQSKSKPWTIQQITQKQEYYDLPCPQSCSNIANQQSYVNLSSKKKNRKKFPLAKESIISINLVIQWITKGDIFQIAKVFKYAYKIGTYVYYKLKIYFNDDLFELLIKNHWPANREG